MKNVFLSALIVFLSIGLEAQNIVNGTIINSKTGENLQNVSIKLVKTKSGTLSNENGEFSLSVPQGKNSLTISSIGFESKIIDFKIKQYETIELGRIFLNPVSIELEEISIISSLAEERKTPVAVTSIQSKEIENELGDRPFPEIMNQSPGVYATRTGGGSGDARISIRGFKQENIAMLLNGLPINSVENGLVYWNNWIGLTDATRQIQVQRGLGASNIALNSIGGTINIITKPSENKKGGSIRYLFTDYGNSKINLSLSSGKLKNDFAVTFLGSHTKGPGYVDATYVESYAYFLTISKGFGKNHRLIFTALGNPEKHGQRNFKLSKNEIDEYGDKFNKDWGSYNGKTNNASENFYYKPNFALNHYWNISEKSFLATSAYLSFGEGGGKWTESFNNAPAIFSYRNPSNQIDWNRIYNNNANNTEIYTLADGTDTSGYSLNVQTNFLASHVWTGLLSKWEYKANENIKIISGIHGRYFKSKLREKIRDLLGGKFFIEDYAWAVDGVAGRNQIKKTGDIIKINNGAIINFGSAFSQIEYSNGNVSAFLAGTISNNWYQRFDKYNYIKNTKSKTISKAGADIKLGLNYNLNEKNNVYFNSGYFSKAPYFKFVFGNYTNDPSKDINNEKLMAFELGYNYIANNTKIKLNTYYTYLKDVAFLSNEYIQLENNQQTRAMVTGLNALHKGIELEISSKINYSLEAGAVISFGDWKWKNNVIAHLYNNDNVIVDTVKVYADGLFVGDSPQTQIGLFTKYNFSENLFIKADWVYYDRLYADFNPATRNVENNNTQSYKIPSYSLLNIYLNHSFSILNTKANANISCFNLFNNVHIIRGEDGAKHNLEDFRGFWSFGRTFNFSLSIFF
ncbi:MAG: TonB-dependent receptor [Bacteroidales bacterium]|nr:TonB-dependent receptor [Bacteroidales bacterium]